MARCFMDNAARFAGVMELVGVPDSQPELRRRLSMSTANVKPQSGGRSHNPALQVRYTNCRGDGTGRRAGLKIRCQKWCGGSSPPPGTTYTNLFLSVNRTNILRVLNSDTTVSLQLNQST